MYQCTILYAVIANVLIITKYSIIQTHSIKRFDFAKYGRNQNFDGWN